MYARTVLIAFAAAACLSSVAGAQATSDELQVATTQGEVRGVVQNESDAFLGIPYAAPPVGPLRWREPQPAEAWTGVRDATGAPPACMQGPPGTFGPFTQEFVISPERSEDCLYLNVWRPKTADTRLPVFFWIHGGGFGSGSASIPVYNGSNLASRGVVVVNINYRLGVFGFLAHPELTAESPQRTSGNYGLLDMIAALEWVRANIEKFGGDPNNITIAGQSAGAAAVNDLLMSEPARGLFQKAIAQSGSGMGILTPSLAEAEQFGQPVQATLQARSLAGLRQATADQLMAATLVPPPAAGESGGPTLSLAPNIDHKVLSANPEPASNAPVSNVPFITGYNADEGVLFPPDDLSPSTFASGVRDRYGRFAERLLALYPHATQAETVDSLYLMARDRYMASLVLWSQERVRTSGERVYTYLYDHAFPQTDPRLAAFHTAEVPYVFGALEHPGRTFTDADHRVSRELQAHWIAFMKTGDPSTPDAPWPAVTPSSTTVKALGDANGMPSGVSTEARFEAFRDFVASGGTLSLF